MGIPPECGRPEMDQKRDSSLVGVGALRGNARFFAERALNIKPRRVPVNRPGIQEGNVLWKIPRNWYILEACREKGETVIFEGTSKRVFLAVSRIAKPSGAEGAVREMRKKPLGVWGGIGAALLGALAGTLLGEVLGPILPWLNESLVIGPSTLNLQVVGGSLWFRINLLGVLGALVALWVVLR